jgi:hypothetical protein
MTQSLASKTTFDPAHPSALAIYCSDGRFTEPVEELLRHLGNPRLDTLTMPGGPGLLNMLTAGFMEVEAMKDAATFLIRGHAIKRVVLIAHEGCGYYKRRMSGLLPERVKARQIEDLAAAAEALTNACRGIEVVRFYARVEGGRVVFEAGDSR